MSSFFELFSPNLRFQREQKDLEKMLIVKTPTTGKGPVQVDLDKGKIHIRRPAAEPGTAPEATADHHDATPVGSPDDADDGDSATR